MVTHVLSARGPSGLSRPNERGEAGYNARVSWVFAALLAAAVAVMIAAEWPRIADRLRIDGRLRRRRKQGASHLHLVRTDQDEFAESVRRDLDSLPTIEEQEHRRY